MVIFLWTGLCKLNLRLKIAIVWFGVRMCVNCVYKQINNPAALYKVDKAHDTLIRGEQVDKVY